MQTTGKRTGKRMLSNSVPLVSICTVTYERQPLLPLLEQCLVLQDYPPTKLEWVIIDDSDDGPTTFDFSEAREAGITVRYIFLDKRLRLGEKRNRSHEHCTGEYIVTMDDDDYYPPTRVSHAIAALENSGYMVAGSSELPLLLLPECSTWMIHPFGRSHATGNTLAFHRSYLESHAYEPEATHAEEAYFLDDFTVPMVQLEPLKTITCIGHSRNTVDKRRFLTSTHGQGVSRVYTAEGQFAPAQYLADYADALTEIESRHKHGILTKALVDRSEELATTNTDAPNQETRIAVITPYYKEDLAILKRCHASVQAQTIPCTHFLVADGKGRDELDALDCRHIRLGGAGHHDNGNTPRSVGALCAMNEGYTCIAYLDADNWFLPDHLELALSTQKATGCEVVFTGREIAFPDGELLPQLDDEDLDRSHADTSSMVIFATAFRSLSLWAQMPRELGPHCDRVAFSYLTSHFKCAWSNHCSVVFETWYWGHFTAAGRLAPANAKFLHARPAEEWQDVSDRFRHRSHTPFLPSSLPESPKKTKLNLISILGPVGCGAHRLQRDLCHHITFFGLPPNNFLYRWQRAFGDQGLDRHASSTIISHLQRLEEQEPINNDWRLDPLIDETTVLSPDRSFTALEAYFRLVQATMPERSRQFSHINGVSNLIERSSSAAYAAQLLFELLPMHRALLVIADPIDQITRLKSVYSAQAMTCGDPAVSIEELCSQYLEALLEPLEAAPVGQLLIVRKEVYDQNPEKSLREVVNWLGQETPEWPKGLQRKIDTTGVVNQVYEAELEAIKQEVEKDIHLHDLLADQQGRYRWGDLEVKLEAIETAPAVDSQLSDSEYQLVSSFFSPLLQLLQGSTSEDELDPADPEPGLMATTDSAAQYASSLSPVQGCVLRLCQHLRERLNDCGDHLFRIPGEPLVDGVN